MRQFLKRAREDTPPVLSGLPSDVSGSVYSTERVGWDGGAHSAAGAVGDPANAPLPVTRISSNPRQMKRTRTEQRPEQSSRASQDSSAARDSYRGSVDAFASFSSMAGSISSRSSLESLRFSIGDSPAMKSVSEMRRSGIRGESMDDIDELLELDDSLDLESLGT